MKHVCRAGVMDQECNDGRAKKEGHLKHRSATRARWGRRAS